MSDKHEQVAREISRYWSPRGLVERSELDEREAIRLALAQLQPILERAFPEPVDPASLTPERVCEMLNAAKHQERDDRHPSPIPGRISSGVSSFKGCGEYIRLELLDGRIIAAYYLQGRISK